MPTFSVTTVTTTFQISVTAAITVDGSPFWKWNGVRLRTTPDPEGG